MSGKSLYGRKWTFEVSQSHFALKFDILRYFKCIFQKFEKIHFSIFYRWVTITKMSNFQISGQISAIWYFGRVQIPKGSFQKKMTATIDLSFDQNPDFVIFQENPKMTHFRIFQNSRVILGFLLLFCCYFKNIESGLSLGKN